MTRRPGSVVAGRGAAVPFVLVVLTTVAVLAACGGGGRAASSTPTPSPPTSLTPSPTPTTSAPTTPTSAPAPPSSAAPSGTDRATQVLAGLDLREQAGQLIMTGLRFGNDSGATFDALREAAIGNVFLGGRSTDGVDAVADLTAQLQAAAPAGVPLLVATDQEGGQVQVLSGPGFDTLPSGVEQGRIDPATLHGDATTWGRQLAAAGVRVDLGPVLDTVPVGADNPPIGGYDREFGHDPATVSAHGVAVATGLAAAGVVATGKHFPGLGRVDLNTDTHAGVTDTVTTASDPYLQPFRAAIRAGIGMIMVSSAVYTRIDGRQQACFSSTVVSGLLRSTLGFRGVVVTDDLGNATAVADVPVGDRATRFVDAGGDLVLDVAPGQAPSLAAALVAKAQAEPAFAAKVRAAALRVLRLKASLGLLG
ncbi:glycoside hydrolase family 3 N-terminal domain-containing protein [Jatrophihabitans sp. YIM 134969]